LADQREQRCGKSPISPLLESFAILHLFDVGIRQRQFW
jgi:hypothetical protein